MSNPHSQREVDKIAFNTRCMELARHNGLEIDLRVPPWTNPMDHAAWLVPAAFVPIVGNALVVVERGHGC